MLKAAGKVLGHLETDQYGVKNAMALILWDLLMEQQPLAVMPTDDYHSETALRELWCGWETPMLNCGIHVELNGVIDEFMKKHDQIARGGFDHGGYGCGECEVRGSDAEGTRAGHPGGLASSLEVSRG